MKINAIVILLILLFQKSNLLSQNSIKISGYIDTVLLNSFDSQELQITIKEVANRKNTGTVFKTRISEDGSFNINIPTERKLQYLSFECITSGEQGNLGGVSPVWRTYNSPHLSGGYLFEKGDSVYMFIRKGENYIDVVEFSGKGSEKLNCQYQINTTPSLLIIGGYSMRIADLWSKKEKFPSYIKLFRKAYDFQIEMRMSLLESYRDMLAKDVFELLYLDALSTAQYDAYNFILNNLGYFNKSEEILPLKNLQRHISATDYNITYDSLALNRSYYYADMLLKQSITISSLNRKNHKTSFTDTYNIIVNEYSGELRDKLIYLCYEELITDNFDEAVAKQNDALSRIASEHYKSTVKTILDSRTKIYPFELLDADDKVYRLTDFNRKVVVIDFWFTGCVPCASLAEAMHPIYEKYRNNPDIIFVTISTDRKKLWLQSVESGIYTAPGMLNLHTGGLGFQHPLIKHFRISGLPRQLIISKNNQLITSSPPRPSLKDDTNRKEFEKILDDALNQ